MFIPISRVQNRGIQHGPKEAFVPFHVLFLFKMVDQRWSADSIRSRRIDSLTILSLWLFSGRFALGYKEMRGLYMATVHILVATCTGAC